MKGIKFFYITCPKKKEAQKIATFLVKKKLVARSGSSDSNKVRNKELPENEETS